MIKTNELHWVAGFLEGEGAFMCHNHRRPQQKVTYPYWVPIVDAVQVNREPIERLQATFGGRIVSLAKNRNGNRQQAYSWRLHGRRAIAFMMTMWTLMSGRRRAQIETAIARWKSNPGHRSEEYRQSRPRGNANAMAKLTPEIVLDIRGSAESNRRLAVVYGVSAATISNVRHRKVWGHVLDNRAIA